MKKFIVFLVAVGLVLYGASPLFAGGAINKNNLSAEYIRTMNRAAATDSADIVAYNPAGTTAFEDGMYGNFSFQYIDKEYENLVSGTEYTTTEPSTIPELYVVYKKGQWAGFFGFNVPLGGGKVEYPNGNATTIGIQETFGGAGPMKLEAESYGLGYTFGGAYRINNMFSVSVGARYIDVKKWLNATAPAATAGGQANVEYDTTANGWGLIFGLDIFPNEDLTFGFKYETKTRLKTTYDWASGSNLVGRTVLGLQGITNGGEANEDLPALFSAGVSWNITPALRIEPTFTYYFNKDADIGGISTAPTAAPARSLEDRIGNGYDLGAAVEYAFTKTLKASLGLLYTDTGVDPSDMSKDAPELNARSICTGLNWQAAPRLDFTFGIGKVFYQSETTTTSQNNVVELSKDVTYLGFGVEYKFF